MGIAAVRRAVVWLKMLTDSEWLLTCWTAHALVAVMICNPYPALTVWADGMWHGEHPREAAQGRR